jgi:hypothetical protein
MFVLVCFAVITLSVFSIDRTMDKIQTDLHSIADTYRLLEKRINEVPRN